MGVPKLATSLMSALLASCLAYGTQTTPQDSDKSRQTNSSSSQKTHRRHVTVAEEEGPQPELAKAEELIQKHDYAQAESVLQKLVGTDPENYVAWFDLGFVENGLGKHEDSIKA
jgi:Tfp pilus assembly protein PilF